MTHHFTVREAKSRLSHLLDLVAAGEEVVVERKDGRGQRFRLSVDVPTKPAVRGRGALKGRIWIADDFDDESPDLTRLFEEGDGEGPDLFAAHRPLPAEG